MTSAYSINLNFNNTIPVKTDFTFKQGDKGITLNLATTGLDPTGTTAHIVFKRSNGTSVEAELTGQTGPSYSYTILGNEFEIPGVVVADLKLYNGDTQRVSTASFIFLVTGDTMDGVGSGTGGYSDQLEQLSQEFEDTLTQYEEAFADVGAVHAAGNYDPTTEYSPLDLVYYSTDNSTYLCIEGCTGETPSPSSQYWQLVVDGSAMSTPNLGDLNDVDTTGASSGDLLSFDGADWAPVDFPDADDIDYDNTSSGLTATKVRAAIDEVKGLIPTIPTIPEKTSDLSDVASTVPTNGQILKYNGTSQKYEPANESGGRGSQPNLLINGWFTVNQRGFTSETITSEKYTVDRWLATGQSGSSGTFAKTSSGFSITASSADSAYIQQRFEDTAFLNGKTVTMSVMFSDGTIKSGTAVIDTSASVNLYDDSDITLRHSASVKAFQFTVKAGKTKVVKALKLEIGSTSTLHLDTAPDYPTELLKCQRYFYKLTANIANGDMFIGVCSNATTIRAFTQFPTTMRISPTISTSGTFSIVTVSGSQTASSVTGTAAQTTQQIGHIAVIGTGLTAGQMVFIRSTSIGDSVNFDAEL